MSRRLAERVLGADRCRHPVSLYCEVNTGRTGGSSWSFAGKVLLVGGVFMSDTSDPGDPDALPSEDSPPHGKRHCPVCGGADLIKCSAVRIKDLGDDQGVVPVAHLLTVPSRGVKVFAGSPIVYFAYGFIDTKTGEELKGHRADPFVRLCLSCGFMAWHLNRADRERIREERDRLMKDRD
jgi:hypothetical protein